MTTVAVEIPDLETEAEDETEALIEQVVAQAMASHDIECGTIGAERVERHDDWSEYEPCPECGSEQVGESCIAHGWTSVSPAGMGNFELEQLSDPLLIECSECRTVCKDSVIIE